MKSFALDSNNGRVRSIDARLRLANCAARVGMGLLWLTLVVVSGTNARARTPSRPDPVSFRRQIAPILVKKCLACHDDRKASGGLSLATFAALERGGKTVGEAILDPGDPESSYLIATIRRGAPIRMPYKQPPLKVDEVAVLTRWVKEGAKFDGPSAAVTPLAALVDVLADLPKVALKVPAADAVSSLAFSRDGRHLAAAVGRTVIALRRWDGQAGCHPGGPSGACHIGAVHARRGVAGRGWRPAGAVRLDHPLGRGEAAEAARCGGPFRRDPRRRRRSGAQVAGNRWV